MTGTDPIENIAGLVYLIRGRKVMMDRDLAVLYGVSTEVFNRAVKKKASELPREFMFRLAKKEKNALVTKSGRFFMLKPLSELPYAFTEQGITKLSFLLNRDQTPDVR